MSNLLKILPLKVLIKMCIDILKYIASKTKNTTDDEIIIGLLEIFNIVLPIIILKKK